MNKLLKIEELGISSRVNVLYALADTNDQGEKKDKPNAFKAIGVGEPLVLRFHTLHVGDLKTGILRKTQSVLVSSLIKDDVTYEVPARCVHQVFKNIKDRQTLYPKASNEGTELIYYTKAFDAGKLKVEIEVKADRFKKESMDELSGFLASSAGLPIFTPYAGLALVGSKLIKVGGDIVKKIIGNKSILSFPFDVADDIGGIDNTDSGFLIGGNVEQMSAFKGYHIDHDPYSTGNVYLAKDGIKYSGDIPYIIISLDGRKVDRYEGFKATIASAGLIQQFYNSTQTTNLDNIQSILGIYNDYSYIKKYHSASKKIEASKDEIEVAKLKKLLAAYKENIVDEALKKQLS